MHVRSLQLTVSLLALTLLLGSSALAAADDGVATLGSPAPDASAPPPDQGAGDPMDAMLDFAACMREHGIDMPDPQPVDGGGAIVVQYGVGEPGSASAGDIEAFTAAEEACRVHMEAFERPPADPERDAELMESMLAYVACMREQGIEMADPIVEGGGVRIEGRAEGAAADEGSERFQLAAEACRDVHPFTDVSVSPAG